MKLPAQCLAVKILPAFDRIALLNRTQRGRANRQVGHLKRHRFSVPRAHVHERPPIGRSIRDLNIVLYLQATVHQRRNLDLRRAVFDWKVEITLLDLENALSVGE